VIEDYAHHPAEIRALLSSLRAARGAGRAADRRLPAAPAQPDGPVQGGVRRLAQPWPTASTCWTCTRRASRRSGGTTADVYAEIKRGAPLLRELPAGRRAGSRLAPARRGRGTSSPLSAPGDIDRTAREWVEAARGGRGGALGPLLRGGAAAPVHPAKLTARGAPGPKTTLRVGGAARLYAEPATEEDLRTCSSSRPRRGRARPRARAAAPT
jgi:UDP-N-acetylmuramate--alanine ligase